MLTPQQNVLIVDIPRSARPAIDAILATCGVRPIEAVGAVERHALACPALPTCGLALAEAERALPGIVAQLESRLAELGLGNEPISIRMTGCPNGCARPHMAEMALVGKAPGKYQLYLGGNASSTRLAQLYKESVKNEELDAEFRSLFTKFARERQPAERFGDFCHRAVLSQSPPVEASVAA